MRWELEAFDDIVTLGIAEGYRMNSRKGLLFLEWIAQHSRAEFLLKIDDDVYFRPGPLLAQLQLRPPASYIWGFFDYISPVPREDGHAFFNTKEDFPFEVFPPYPRGLVRVLSMDIVRRLAEASRSGNLNMVYGDDPCIGVHLRQLLFSEKEPLPMLALDDRDSYRVFAMEPSCNKKLWSKITGRTWVVHHVSAAQIKCMWEVDKQAGYYWEDSGVHHNSTWPLHSLPELCECAKAEAFESRSDMETIKQETNRILAEEV